MIGITIVLHVNPYFYRVLESDFKVLEDVVKKIVKEKQPFERLEMTKEDLLEMFKYNPFKVRILNERVKTPTTTVYRCGPLIDLCRGPHVRHTGKIKAMTGVLTIMTLYLFLFDLPLNSIIFIEEEKSFGSIKIALLPKKKSLQH